MDETATNYNADASYDRWSELSLGRYTYIYISIAFSSRLQTIHSPEAESVCIVPYTYARFGHSLPILFCFL